MTMTDDHKAALAAGREQGRIVRVYLEAIQPKPKRRGRKPQSPEAELARVTAALADTSEPLERLKLIQERIDLEAALAQPDDDEVDIQELEDAFVRVAGQYSTRKGLSRAAWRAVNVPASVIKKAGL